jgi:hypothetical protein
MCCIKRQLIEKVESLHRQFEGLNSHDARTTMLKVGNHVASTEEIQSWFKAEVTGHDQKTDAHGKKFTAYAIKVVQLRAKTNSQQYIEHATYSVSRRYREFFELYTAIAKDNGTSCKFPFPAKAIFVNQPRRFQGLRKFMTACTSLRLTTHCRAKLLGFLLPGTSSVEYCFQPSPHANVLPATVLLAVADAPGVRVEDSVASRAAAGEPEDLTLADLDLDQLTANST